MTEREKLKKDYAEVCDRYVAAFCEMYGYAMCYCWWISDERGGVLSINDLEYSISMGDLQYLVDNNIPEKVFNEWWDYCLDNEKFDVSLRQYCQMKNAGLL